MEVIEKCTNMWWNPINHFKRKLEKQLFDVTEANNTYIQQLIPNSNGNIVEKSTDELKEAAKKSAKRKKSKILLDEFAGEKWFFSCTCGEKCSYYEAARYHPKGAQYECSKCRVWSHVKCVLGKLPENENEVLSEPNYFD